MTEERKKLEEIFSGLDEYFKDDSINLTAKNNDFSRKEIHPRKKQTKSVSSKKRIKITDSEPIARTKAVTIREMKKKRNSQKRKYKKTKGLLKEVKGYEEAKTDVTKNKDWKKFKLGLLSVFFASVVLLSVGISKKIIGYIQGNNDSYTTSDGLKDEEKDVLVELNPYKHKNGILLKSGYHFDNISEKEYIDIYYKIFDYEKKITEGALQSASFRIFENADQKLLDEIVKKALGAEYEKVSEDKKRDYRQLAFELLEYSHPNTDSCIRNPIVVDGLEIRDNLLKEKGYRIKLKINGDEEETIRNLGNIMHFVHEIKESDLEGIKQEEFYDNALKKVFETNLDEMSQEEKNDYKQIIYEFLPDNVKKHIKDPIELEKSNQEQIEELEV